MAWFRTRLSAAAGLALVFGLSTACGGGKPAKSASSSGSSEGDNKSGPAEVGKAAPDLSIQTVNGKGQITISSLAGKVAVVDFWATWCGPCKQSFPKLEEIAKQNSGKVAVVGISVDDDSSGVADFAKSNGATFAIGWDDGHTIANRWKVDSMPTTYILDATGKVRFIHAGYHDGEADAIVKELATLTSEDGGGGSTTKAKTDDAAESASKSASDPPAGDAPAAGGGGDEPSDEATEAPPPKPAKKAGKKKGGKKKGGKKHPKKKKK